MDRDRARPFLPIVAVVAPLFYTMCCVVAWGRAAVGRTAIARPPKPRAHPKRTIDLRIETEGSVLKMRVEQESSVFKNIDSRP